jgi:hypothetical protein
MRNETAARVLPNPPLGHGEEFGDVSRGEKPLDHGRRGTVGKPRLPQGTFRTAA